MSEARNFLADNQEALKILRRKMREIELIGNIDTKTDTDIRAEIIGRKMAIEIIESWLDELFEIERGGITNLASDEDDMIIVRE